MNHENETLTGDVTLDDTVFSGCTFRDCRLHYRGGHFRIDGPTTYERVTYSFEGSAENTVRMLARLYASEDGGPEMVAQMLRDLGA